MICVKYLICLLFLLLLCSSCTNENDQVVLFSKELGAVSLLSPASDSLLNEVNNLSRSLRVKIILDLSSRKELNIESVVKQERLLLEVLDIASKEERRRILQRLILLYEQLDQLGFTNSALKGISRCEELEKKYFLSENEKCDLQRKKIFFLNREGSYKESISILYNLLKIHRLDNQEIDVSKDLYEIATYFIRLGDPQKGLELLNEAYEYSLKKGITEQQSICLSSIINTSFNLKYYNEVVNIYNKVMSDSIAKSMFSSYYILSKSYLQLQKYDSARYYLTKMIQKSQKGYGIVFYCRMAETYILENREDSATFYLNVAMNILPSTNKIQKKSKLPLYFMYIYPSYASLLHKNGKIKQADEAFQLVEPLMKAPVSEPERWEKQIDALSRYSDFCLSTKQYKKATELLVFRDSIQKVYYENKISLDAKNWTGRFEIQELRFDNEKKQEEINNTKRISSIIATVSFILFGFTVATVCMYRYIRKQNKKLRENQAQMALLLNPKPVVVKKREPLTPQEQLFELASKTVKSQKLFLNSKLTLDELAEILGTNRSTLSSCINQCAKCNFNKWINNYRIDYIKKRITATSNSRDLCTEAGFNSINTFTNSFKERLGCTPSEYIDTCKYEALQEDTQ